MCITNSHQMAQPLNNVIKRFPAVFVMQFDTKGQIYGSHTTSSCIMTTLHPIHCAWCRISCLSKLYLKFIRLHTLQTWFLVISDCSSNWWCQRKGLNLGAERIWRWMWHHNHSKSGLSQIFLAIDGQLSQVCGTRVYTLHQRRSQLQLKRYTTFFPSLMSATFKQTSYMQVRGREGRLKGCTYALTINKWERMGCSMHVGSRWRVSVESARASSLPSPALPSNPHQRFSWTCGGGGDDDGVQDYCCLLHHSHLHCGARWDLS